MIKSKYKVEALSWDKDMATLLFTVVVLIYVLESTTLSELTWLVFINFVLLGLTISYLRTGFTRQVSENQNFSWILNSIRVYLAFICLTALLLYTSPNLFASILASKRLFVAAILGIPAISISIHFLAVSIVHHAKVGSSRKRSTLIAGTGNLALDVEKALKGYKVKGYIRCKNEECMVEQDRVVGELDDIHDYLRTNAVDEIVIAIPVKPPKKIRHIISAADYHGVRVKYVPDYQSYFGSHYKTVRHGRFEAVNARQLPLDGTLASFNKNVFDFFFALFALLFLLPLFIVIAVLIKLDSAGPVFYCPVRIGRGGRPFKVYKFRSMSQNDSTLGGVLSTNRNDPRVTRVGRFLRKYSLDELPQFFNVLFGNMSVVGPRPHRSYLNKQLQESEEKYMIRHYFKPGITGWAQVNGWRGPTETKEQKHQRTRHDIWYMENWTFMLDLKIIYKTMFSRKVHKNAF